jgi:hypothetical protein
MITIATSLFPREIEAQRKAIQSWIDIGFDVISVNSTVEAAEIRLLFPEVTVVEVNRNSAAFAKKPCVYFDDVLKALESAGSQICGIINSDIHLKVNSNFYDWVYEKAKKSFIYGSRIDVQTMECLNGEDFVAGFDYFFFDREVISVYKPTDFCIGLPMWETWAIFMPIASGVPSYHLISPVAFHVRHSLKWDCSIFDFYRIKMFEYLHRDDIKPLLTGHLLKYVSEVDQFLFSALPFTEYFFKTSEKVILPEEESQLQNCSVDYARHLIMIHELKLYKHLFRVAQRNWELAEVSCRKTLCCRFKSLLKRLLNLV